MDLTWHHTELGKHIQTQKGFAFKSPWYCEDGRPLVKVSDFTEDSVDTSALTYIPEEIAADYLKYELQAGDVIIQTVGSWPTNPQSVVGKVIKTPSRATGALLNQNAVKIIPDEGNIDKAFLYYLLRSSFFKAHIIGCAQGAASQASITLEDIRRFDFNLPFIPIQRRIAAILSAYDDLIENNTRRIRILEEMAQMLYREWFVHFRFPGHERVKMKNGVPEGWKIDRLGNHINVDKGVSYNGEGLTEYGFPMVNLKNILPNGGFRRDSVKPYSGEYKPRHTVCPGDIVLANTDLTQAGNVVGSPAIVPQIPTDGDILMSHHIFAVRFLPEALIPKYYLYNLMRTYEFKSFAKGYASGTTVLGLPRDGVLEFTFVRPPFDLLKQFDGTAEPSNQLMELYEEKNELLRRTRDLLLPRLVSGEIDVSDLVIRVTSR